MRRRWCDPQTGSSGQHSAVDRALIEAASWRLAAEVCRHLPHLAIIETHPGGGLYDCLTLVTSDFKPVAHLNRVGSVVLHQVREGMFSVWPTLLEPNSVRQWVRRFAALLGADPDVKLPPTTPRVLTYRIIASAVGMPFATSRWECRNGACDTSGEGSGVREEFFALPGVSAHAHFPQDAAKAFRLAYRYWFICRGHQPVAALHDSGVGWTSSGELVPLWDLYQANRRIGPLLSRLVGHAME